MDNFTSLKKLEKKKGKFSKFMIFGNLLLLVVLVSIGGYFFKDKLFPSKQKKAFTGQISATDSCNKVKIEVVENPSCNRLYNPGNQSCPAPAGAVNNVSSFSTVFRVTSNDGQTHQISWKTASEFCSNACGSYTSAFGGNYSCTDSSTSIYQEKTEAVNPGQSLEVVVTRSSPSGQACGTYQQDLWIESIDGNAQCNFKSVDNNVGAWSMCQTGVACPSCQQLYYCDKSDPNNLHCVQTSSPQGYQTTSPYNQCGVSNPPTCASNLETYSAGKTTGVCYISQSNCDAQCGTPTSTPPPPTNTPPVATNTPPIATNTPTATPTPTPTATPVITNTPTATPIITNTPTSTPVLTNTPSPSATPTEIILAKISPSPTTTVQLLQTGVIKSFIYWIPAVIILVGLIL